MKQSGQGRAVLESLLEGNRAFREGQGPAIADRTEIARLCNEGQRPRAAVLCCSDSRVTPELVFCQGLGQIFSIRTAGNVVSDFERGSVEYAVADLGARLVLVMGHSGCGAVAGALQGKGNGCMKRVLSQIAPSVEQAIRQAALPEQVAEQAENFNILSSLALLRADPVLASVPDLTFAAAKYNTQTGEVTLLQVNEPENSKA